MSAASSNTKQPRFRIVPVRMDNAEVEMLEEEECTEMAREEAGDPPTWAQATARILPRSALMALAAHPHDTSTPREVINGLINNL